MSAARAILALLAATLALGACVTETVRSDGTRRPPAPAGDGPAIDGPIATPAYGAPTLNTRVKVALTPLGSIPYDGQVLPLVSPDGRFLAVQEGQAPTWPTMLAQPDASVPIRTRLAIYDLSGAAPKRVPVAEPLPPGLVLGRGADARSFLVESPRPDGARWIGRVDWAGGRLTWLVRTGEVNAQATIGPGGALVYARRPINSPRFSLVVDNVPVSSGAAESIEYPFATGEPGFIYALERSDLGTSVVGIRHETGSDAVVARRRLSPSADPLVAYQAAAPAFAAPSPGDGGRSRLVLFLPRAERMGVFNPVAASLAPLPDKSIAAAYVATSDGYFCTTPDGMVFTPRPDPGDPWEQLEGVRPPPIAKVLGDPFVPHATTNPDRPFILLGPDPRSPDRLSVFALKPIQ